MRLFKKTHPKWHPTKKNFLKDFSIMNVSSRDVMMLLYHLYKEYDMYHITYEFRCNRCYLYYISDNVPSDIRSFFDDRSSYDIEYLAMDCGEKYKVGDVETCGMVEYADGFKSPEVFKWKEKKREFTADEKKDKIVDIMSKIYNILDPSGKSTLDFRRQACSMDAEEFMLLIVDVFTKH